MPTKSLFPFNYVLPLEVDDAQLPKLGHIELLS